MCVEAGREVAVCAVVGSVCGVAVCLRWPAHVRRIAQGQSHTQAPHFVVRSPSSPSCHAGALKSTQTSGGRWRATTAAGTSSNRHNMPTGPDKGGRPGGRGEGHARTPSSGARNNTWRGHRGSHARTTILNRRFFSFFFACMYGRNHMLTCLPGAQLEGGQCNSVTRAWQWVKGWLVWVNGSGSGGQQA